jgi:hypothetical protein
MLLNKTEQQILVREEMKQVECIQKERDADNDPTQNHELNNHSFVKPDQLKPPVIVYI